LYNEPLAVVIYYIVIMSNSPVHVIKYNSKDNRSP
jgi:hypothetical protein